MGIELLYSVTKSIGENEQKEELNGRRQNNLFRMVQIGETKKMMRYEYK